MKHIRLIFILLFSLSTLSCQGSESKENDTTEKATTNSDGNILINWKSRLSEVDQALVTQETKKADGLLKKLMKDYESEYLKKPDEAGRDLIFQMAERLAILANETGDYEMAVIYGLSVVQHNKNRYGDSSEQYFSAIANLATTYSLKGDLDRAINAANQVLSMCQRTNYLNYSTCDSAIANLSLVHLKSNDLKESEKIALLGVEVAEKIKGKNSEEVIPTLNVLAQVYISQKRYKDAHSLYLRGVNIAKLRYPSNHVAIIVLEKNLNEFENKYKPF